MNLVIVESPTKARTISRFLENGYQIKASMGHIMDLPKSKLGVLTDENFSPQYEFVKDKTKVISELKSLAKEAETIILATDADREGEAIASHVKDVLAQNQKSKIKNKIFKRIVFHEITKEAIEEALKNPRSIDENLVDAQTARRVLDRLVGYKLSPILWQKVRRGLSAGRVQSVALRLIAQREKEIEKFKKEPYYTITVNLKSQKPDAKTGDITPFELYEINREKIEISEKLNLYDGEYKFTKTSIDNRERAEKIEEDLKDSEFVVSDVLKRETKRTPPPPYTTSTLQQDAARKMGLSGRRTMVLAQKLYEEGYITYHRTDSVFMASSAIFSIRNYVEKTFGKNYIPEKPRFYKTKSKVAQEAHEAIRPTGIQSSESIVQNQLGKDYGKLYEIIWRRAAASQMADAVIESTAVIVDSQNSKIEDERRYRLKVNGSVLVFDGFLKVNPQSLEDRRLPDFTSGEKLEFVSSLSQLHETLPPPRYNDASIIKTLEEKGIGRPSTYATIISTIEARQYIERIEGRFHPTNVGVAVNDFLVSNFSAIDDIPFTARMEDELDDIAKGERKWQPVIKEFYEPFEKKLEDVKSAARVKIEVETTNEVCPKDAGKLVIRIGRFGKFLACENFPKCDFTKPFVENTNLVCPKDGGKIVVKKSKRGRRFYGCSNYPKCDFAAWKLEDVKKL